MKNFKPELVILYVYLIISQFLAVYFWYLWSKEHDFLSTVFIGPIVAEFKALLFPFFL